MRIVREDTQGLIIVLLAVLPQIFALTFPPAIKCGGIQILFKLAIIIFPFNRWSRALSADGLLKVAYLLLQKFGSNPAPLTLLVLYSTYFLPLIPSYKKAPRYMCNDKYQTGLFTTKETIWAIRFVKGTTARNLENHQRFHTACWLDKLTSLNFTSKMYESTCEVQ